MKRFIDMRQASISGCRFPRVLVRKPSGNEIDQ